MSESTNPGALENVFYKREEIIITPPPEDNGAGKIDDIHDERTSILARVRHLLGDVSSKLREVPIEENAQEYEAFVKQMGAIERLVKRHDIYFVHATSPTNTNATNEVVDRSRDLSWQDKIDIILAHRPTISTSTFRPNSFAYTWDHLGVILKSGTAAAAYTTDGMTYATGLKERLSRNEIPKNRKEYQRSVESAIYHDSRFSWNEIVIDRPAVAGLFVNLDPIPPPKLHTSYHDFRDVFAKTSIGYRDKEIPYSDIYDYTRELQMPIYAIYYGQVYEVGYDTDKGTLVKGKAVSPQAILDVHFTIPHEKLEEISKQSGTFLKSP